MTPSRLYQLIKNMYHYVQAHMWRAIYGFPQSGLHIYGVTGTNGKTTTSYFLDSILSAEYGREKVGMLTTVAIRMGEREEINKTKLTTLPSQTVYKYLRQMKQAEVEHVVVEITSHALDQHRIAGIQFDGGIVLNLAREHLDYHVTMDDYRSAKQRILNYLKPGAPFVGKADDEHVSKIIDAAKQKGIPTYTFTAKTAQETMTSLPGHVNHENATAAALVARAVGVSDNSIAEGILALTHVPGRMERIETPKGFSVVIDYAVTPDALERLYADIRENTSGRVLALLGAAGNRDRGKRPQMAEVVANYADLLVITREDPWTESEDQIFSDLEQGLQHTNTPWKRIVDRKEALTFLLQQASTEDAVVVTGKGAEMGMGIGKDIIPWNDRQIIEEILKQL